MSRAAVRLVHVARCLAECESRGFMWSAQWARGEARRLAARIIGAGL